MKRLLPIFAALLLATSAWAEEPAGLSNKIRWATASEVENFGYDVYRGLAEEGPFDKITAEPIPGAGTTDTPSRYEYVDDTIEPGIGYFYYVESISMSGQRERFTPIYQSKPKELPVADE